MNSSQYRLNAQLVCEDTTKSTFTGMQKTAGTASDRLGCRGSDRSTSPPDPRVRMVEACYGSDYDYDGAGRPSRRRSTRQSILMSEFTAIVNRVYHECKENTDQDCRHIPLCEDELRQRVLQRLLAHLGSDTDEPEQPIANLAARLTEAVAADEETRLWQLIDEACRGVTRYHGWQSVDPGELMSRVFGTLVRQASAGRTVGVERLPAFVRAVAANQCRNLRRKQHRRLAPFHDARADERTYSTSATEVLDKVIMAESVSRLNACLQNDCSESERALVANTLEGLGPAEIASHLGCTMDAFYSKRRRLFARLRHIVSPEDCARCPDTLPGACTNSPEGLQ